MSIVACLRKSKPDDGFKQNIGQEQRNGVMEFYISLPVTKLLWHYISTYKRLYCQCDCNKKFGAKIGDH